jgi:hypothetical protein
MKALSIHQPWAWLIVNGYKDVENRKWWTDFRGQFLVHAGKQFDYDGYRWVRSNSRINMPEINKFEMGGIVGSAEIIACVTQYDSQWFFGPYGFVLKNARILKFVPLRGKLNFFNVEVEETTLL